MLKWIRTVVIWASALGTAALLLFGPRPHVGEHAEDVVVIDYWEKWGGLEGSQMQQIVDTFNETVGREKKIFVRYLSVSSVNQKTLVATAAGVPPDVAGMWGENVVQFASLGALEPLDELAREYGIEADQYKEVYWKGCQYQGKLYALVSTPAAAALHWNKEIFEAEAADLRAAGLDPNRPPATLDELDAYTEVLTVVDEKGRVQRAGYMPLHPGFWNTALPIWFGGKPYDESTRTLLLNSPEAVNAYTWLRAHSEKYGVKSMTEFRSSVAATFASPTDPMISGTLAMEQQGPWRANYFNDLAPRFNAWKMSKEEEKKLPREQRKINYAWGAAPFPSAVGTPNVSFAGFDIVAIPRGAHHKREAFEFIAYLNRPEVMERICSLHSKNSPLREVSQNFLENHPNPYIDVFEALASSPATQTCPPVPIWAEVVAELNQVGEQVYLQQRAPREALDAAQERMQLKLDRFFAIDDQRKAPWTGKGARP